mgnify:CR=1 FL=1
MLTKIEGLINENVKNQDKRFLVQFMAEIERNVPKSEEEMRLAFETKKEYNFGDRTLRKGMKGTDVEKLQEYLNKLKYDCGKVDGDFGNNTDKQVRNFQKAKNLEVDGIVGKNTIAAINECVKEFNPATNTNVKVMVTGGTVNVRKSNNTSSDILFTANKGDEYQWISTSIENGWHQIKTNVGNAWISGTYSKVINN